MKYIFATNKNLLNKKQNTLMHPEANANNFKLKNDTKVGYTLNDLEFRTVHFYLYTSLYSNLKTIGFLLMRFELMSSAPNICQGVVLPQIPCYCGSNFCMSTKTKLSN